MRPTTHDLQNEHLQTPYVDLSPDHWSNSKEWVAYTLARADAVRLFPANSPHVGRVAETPEMVATLAAFNAKYPPVDDAPAPAPVLDARTQALQAAQAELRRAVTRMRAFAHPLAIVDLVTRMVNE
jgi:hypothetical protein